MRRTVLALSLCAVLPLPAHAQTASGPLPTTRPELLRVLETRLTEVTAQLDGGQTSTIAVPALAAKDVALALEDRIAELPAASRGAAIDAVLNLMLAAWRLEAFAETADLEKVTHTYEQFSAAVAAVAVAYAPR